MGVYVSKVKTNLKKIQEVELGQKTLVVGKNGSGKSSLLNSIELSFGGYVSDFRGKVVKRQQDIIRLSAEKSLSVQCTLSNKSKKSVSITKTQDGTVGKPKTYGKTHLDLPMQEVTSVLEGSSKAFRSWLLKYINLEFDSDRVREVCEEEGVDPETLDLSDLTSSLEIRIESIKDKINKQADVIRSRKKTIEEFSETIDPNVDLTAPGKLKELQEKLDSYDHITMEMQDALESEKRVHSQLQALNEAISKLKGKLETLNSHPEHFPTKQEIVAHNICGDIINMFEAQEHAGQTDLCLVCGGEFHQFQERKTSFIQLQGETTNKIELLTLRSHLEEELEISLEKRTQLNELLSSLAESIQSKTAKFEALGIEDVDYLKDRVSKLQKLVNSVEIYKLRIQEVERVKKEHVEMEEEQKQSKKMLKALLQIQSLFVELAKDQFVDLLNDVISFEVDIDVNDKGVDIGKRESGKLCFGLSGAEYLELKFGLAQLIYPDDSIILAEDRAIDEDRLLEMMEKFSTFCGQVILTTISLPSTIPSGWTVIEL